ncbi:efflux RND transporter periplasmic adaptor subunit [Halorhodospira halophila]|uniref:Efflux transporter, RND family, MFP subunit n=1 Tax=Halorhodospira halophila (strain DSM 244 / SL1) TaxID=349124 RepID=A1WY79_HALHL|nr:efflux RND transporter periplasmic adaptor subunit [Halorhodospira halophila]ABM62641.1 efflux transporter, RND family, MFP subunit [Halorhodospira halophila SL1]MBK1728321.1 efflux RND transporter periplasmic adaptor subunit [Halorhodospira halophila]
MPSRPRTRLQTVLLWVASALILLGAVALFRADLGTGPTGEGRETAAVAVEVDAVERRDLADVRRFDGNLEAAVRYELAPKVTGELRSLEVRIGDTLEPGDLIARLDDQEVAQEVAEAEAGLEVARAQLAESQAALESAERDLNRTRELRERQIASAAELEAAEAQVAAERSRVQLARAQIAQQQATLSAAQIRRSFTEIRADWDEGERVVGERFKDPGATVSAGEAMLTLLDISELRAEAFVTEREYARLMPGQSARLRVEGYPDTEFEAEVARLAPLFSATLRQARVEFTVPNPEGQLRPGMFARLAVEVGRAEDVRTVPREAVVQRGGQPSVFLLEEGEDAPRVRLMPVETGLRAEGRIEVRPRDEEDGEALTGHVVTLGQHLLADGSRVEVVGEQAAEVAAP